MPYAALPARRMPYDIDGTVVGQAPAGSPVISYPALAVLQSWQSDALNPDGYVAGNAACDTWLFFPESREVAAIYAVSWTDNTGLPVLGTGQIASLSGSNDTTNGLDGTYETATLTPSGYPQNTGTTDSWRVNIGLVSFSGTPSTLLVTMESTYQGIGNASLSGVSCLHVYGAKTAGQTPNDIIFIDADLGTPAEFTAPEDFGDRPLGTTVIRSFAIKNVSTLGAHTITLQLDDTDFALGTTNAGPWVQSIDPADLAAGATSPTYYIKNTTPNAGTAALGPRFARCIVQVGSYS